MHILLIFSREESIKFPFLLPPLKADTSGGMVRGKRQNLDEATIRDLAAERKK
jgi:hypothetical protein